MIRQATATSLSRPVGLAPVCEELGIARSTVYAQRARKRQTEPPMKSGPRPRVPDPVLLGAIRGVLTYPVFLGEGYRKVHARLRMVGVHADQERIRFLMGQNSLQAPGRPRRDLGPRVHDGTITTALPDQMWGTDATAALLLDRQQATILGVYDPSTCELMGIHAALKEDRFEAITTLPLGTRRAFGSVQKDVAPDLQVRHDNGSPFIFRAFQAELRFLGMKASPSFVRAPEGNGCIGRFWRTLKEQLLWIRTFPTIEELNLALKAFQEQYNQKWLIARHGYRSPAAIRKELLGRSQAA